VLILFVVSGETLITRLTTQRWLDVGEDWTEDEHRSSHSVMRYEYRVTCDAHYYGAGCANLCRPRDDNFGHYKCSPTGDRVCLSGWQGDYCTKRKYFAYVCRLSSCDVICRDSVGMGCVVLVTSCLTSLRSRLGIALRVCDVCNLP
jgi:hypothetical protein